MNDSNSEASRIFDRQQSRREASALLATWFPSGTPMAAAVETMENNGFTCAPVYFQAGEKRGMGCDLSIPEAPGVHAARLALTGWTVVLIETPAHTVERISVGRFPEHLGDER